MSINEGFISIAEVARILNVASGTVAQWATHPKHNFPAPAKPPHRTRGRVWREDEIRRYATHGVLWNRGYGVDQATLLRFASILDLKPHGTAWRLELPDIVMEDVLRYAQEKLLEYDKLVKRAA